MPEYKLDLRLIGLIDLLIFFIVAAILYPNETFFTLTMVMWLIIVIWLLIITIIMLVLIIILVIIIAR